MSPALAEDDDTLHQIAKPVAIKMTHMKNMYSEKFDFLANFRTTIIMGIVSFIISMALHILLTFLYFRYAPLRRLLSFTHHDKTTNKKIELRPLLTVHDDDFHDAMADPNIGSGKHCVVPVTKVNKLQQQITPSTSKLQKRTTHSNPYDEIEQPITHL